MLIYEREEELEEYDDSIQIENEIVDQPSNRIIKYESSITIINK